MARLIHEYIYHRSTILIRNNSSNLQIQFFPFYLEKRFHSNQSNRDLAIQIGRCNVPTIIRGLSFITRLINNYALLLHETMDLATQRYYTLINTGRSILFATFTQFYFPSLPHKLFPPRFSTARKWNDGTPPTFVAESLPKEAGKS